MALVKLLPLDKDKKSESKSQQRQSIIIDLSGCCRWTKIKNLKANHNLLNNYSNILTVVAVGQR